MRTNEAVKLWVCLYEALRFYVGDGKRKGLNWFIEYLIILVLIRIILNACCLDNFRIHDIHNKFRGNTALVKIHHD
jgi:hypothetical protein